ncbi:MAG: hypothetical protein SGARI_005488, partial [Bacillariaceae sp.]
MMDPADRDAWQSGGADTAAMETVTTFEETTVSTSSASSTTRQLRHSVQKHEKELLSLKEKYEEAKTKMSKMKQEKSANKKMLLEMSGLITALQDISVDYEQTKKSGGKDNNNSSSKHKSHLQNVQRKIQAIDTQMSSFQNKCGMLEEEKSLHTTTIKAQNSQIEALEDQIQLLMKRLEQQSQSNTEDQSDLQNMIQLQETQIWNLEGQISTLKKNATQRSLSSKLEEHNKARYQEIDSLEAKLASLREAQNAHKVQVSSMMRANSKSQDDDDQSAVEESQDDESSSKDHETASAASSSKDEEQQEVLSPVQKEVSSWETRHAPSTAPSPKATTTKSK